MNTRNSRSRNSKSQTYSRVKLEKVYRLGYDHGYNHDQEMMIFQHIIQMKMKHIRAVDGLQIQYQQITILPAQIQAAQEKVLLQ
ncbi:hypothetical protein ACP3T3_03715 [Chryseobacterium sp. CBSDS_008]|uniref:hypothetical protein n=1 Tax=Chryseobacterium sp. CBSDS_008 TaxID=3415265 RepID=UPI003CF97D33